MPIWYFRMPTMVFGEDSLFHLKSLDERRFVIVTDRVIVSTPLLTLLKENLPEGSDYFLFSRIGVEPDFTEMSSEMESIREFNPDCFIALGGGSVIDTAKVLLFSYARPDKSLYELTPLDYLGIKEKAKLVAIPTTSGTGSECTWAAVVSEREGKVRRKLELASTEILPDYAILDPAMVISLPQSQTVSTGVDAISHAIEAYASAWKNPFSDAMAEKALSLISSNLLDVLSNPLNVEKRNLVHMGASMAGIAFSNSQIGLAHALGHALGADFHISHGNAVGLYLPKVVAFNNRNCTARYRHLNNIFQKSDRKRSLALTLESYFSEIGQPLFINETRVPVEEYTNKLESLMDLTMESTGMLTNPREASSRDVRRLLRSVVRRKQSAH